MVNPGKFEKAGIEAYQRFAAEVVAAPPDAMDRIVLDTPEKISVGRLLRHTQDYYAVICSLGMCMRVHFAQFYSMPMLAELYSAVTGIEIDAKGLKRAGERAWNMFKALNVREGQTRKDDTFPHKWLEPLKNGDVEIPLMDQFRTKVLTAKDLDKTLDDYYDERGWEVERGIPAKAKLVELGLAEVVADLDKNGIIVK